MAEPNSKEYLCNDSCADKKEKGARTREGAKMIERRELVPTPLKDDCFLSEYGETR